MALANRPERNPYQVVNSSAQPAHSPDTTSEHHGGHANILAQRMPQVPPDFTDEMWPLRLHQFNHDVAKTHISAMATALSRPVEPTSREQLARLFERWHQVDPVIYTMYDDPEMLHLHQRVNHLDRATGYVETRWEGYYFDNQGRVVKVDYHVPSHKDDGIQRFRVDRQIGYQYDLEGFVTSRTTYYPTIEQGHIDTFEYSVGHDNVRRAIRMERSLFDSADSHTGKKPRMSEKMVIDLADPESNFTRRIIPDKVTELEPQPFEVGDYTVERRMTGIYCEGLGELERALIQFGNGEYPGGNPGITQQMNYDREIGHQDARIEAQRRINRNTARFVRERIMQHIRHQMDTHEPADSDNRVHSFNFHDEPEDIPIGGFYDAALRVKQYRDGYVLSILPRLTGPMGERYEEADLAASLSLPRGLDEIVLTLPVNQSSRQGSFAVDIEASLAALGIELDPENIARTLTAWQQRRDDDEMTGEKPNAQERIHLTGDEHVSATLVIPNYDPDGYRNLPSEYRQDGRYIWGPTATDIHRRRNPSRLVPQLIVSISPPGDPFDYKTHKEAERILSRFTGRLDEPLSYRGYDQAGSHSEVSGDDGTARNVSE